MKHVDLKAAFLNGDIYRAIFVTYIYNIPNNNMKGRIYRFLKSLYGLKQSSLLWFQKLPHVLVNCLEYRQLRTDLTVLINRENDHQSIIMFFVDDLTFISDCCSVLESGVQGFCLTLREQNNHWFGIWACTSLWMTRYHPYPNPHILTQFWRHINWSIALHVLRQWCLASTMT